jgi:hypothetical protein
MEREGRICVTTDRARQPMGVEVGGGSGLVKGRGEQQDTRTTICGMRIGKNKNKEMKYKERRTNANKTA